jgi:O-antigen ligase
MGMHYNDRRLAYVSFTLSLIAWYLLSPWTHAKRMLTRGLIVLSPALPFYFILGWANPTGVFGLLRPFKSIIEGERTNELDPNQMDYRDMENFDVVMTWKKNPLLGSGWGHPFEEVLKLPDISHAFADYLYHPHNSVLGMLAFGGAVGFTGLWAYLVITQFLAARAYHRAHEPEQRTACLVSLSVVIAYVNQCFGDMGSISWIGTILMAMAVVCAGKVATLTRAWPTTQGLSLPVPGAAETGRIPGEPAGTSV